MVYPNTTIDDNYMEIHGSTGPKTFNAVVEVKDWKYFIDKLMEVTEGESITFRTTGENGSNFNVSVVNLGMQKVRRLSDER